MRLTNRDAPDPAAGVRGRRCSASSSGPVRVLRFGAIWRAASPAVTAGRIALGIVGGIAAMVAAGCVAAAIILFQLISAPV